ncbi:hypothetical protein [Lysinibacillus sp. RS5]|uniref:hypothetical protein n=1 Tax=unclassified Lysinibacillus TaxID=2636778 RepID=UPI0035BE43E5
MFSARKRSVSDKCFLCESEASATNVFCAKAKRQQQMFYLCESEASATNVLSVRKRSGSNIVLSVRKRSANVAAATTKRPVGTEINSTL